MDQSNNFFSWVGNIFSAGAILGTLVGVIPSIAAVVALIWYAIQIYESQTVKTWLKSRWRKKLLKLHHEACRIELLLADSHDPKAVERVQTLTSHRIEMDAALREIEEHPPVDL